MPSKNRLKIYLPESYYHIYNRGVNKQKIFRNDYDYAVMLNLFKRHLGNKPVKDPKGKVYKNFFGQIELIAFCLMPNHYHLMIYQHNSDLMQDLMQRIMASYSAYFNRRYERIGPLFQSAYKASLISDEPYLWHISRYIHRNPDDLYGERFDRYGFSSYPYYVSKQKTSWVRPGRILSMHTEHKIDYKEFVQDYSRNKKEDTQLYLADYHIIK